MNCKCTNYLDLELDRKSISDRIKISKQLIKNLKLISKNHCEYGLYRCEICGQLWQGSRAWNWGNEEYIFKVPNISVDSWAEEPYMSPDEMLIYSAVKEDYFKRNSFEISEKKCRKNDCTENAITNDVFCKEHFIENLCSAGILPKKPKGRMFPPYYTRTSL